jgi:hypothetical protein
MYVKLGVSNLNTEHKLKVYGGRDAEDNFVPMRQRKYHEIQTTVSPRDS